MLVRNHSDIFYSSISEHVILVPLLAPLVPLWIELNNQVQKAYTCPFSGDTEPAHIGFTHVYVCFGGTGGKGQYYYVPGAKRSTQGLC